MQIEERPGTSFTSKRQIKSQQRLLNVGPLETEDPTIRMRPETQNVSTHKRFQKPQVMLQDREQLYEELIALKLQLNTLKRENAKLKIKCNNQDRDLKKAVKSDARNDMEIYYSEQQKTSKCIIDLRRQLREKDEELQKKDQLLLSMKKNQKYLENREKEAEIDELKQETVRLRNMLDRLPKSSNVVSTLQQDNVEMISMLENLKCENEQLKLQQHEVESKYKKANNEKNGLKRVIWQMNKEIEELKQTKNLEQKQKKNEMQEQELKSELERKYNECNQLNNGIRLKEKKIVELEDQMRQVQNNYMEKIDDLEREKAILKDTIVQLREENQQQQQQYGKRKTTSFNSTVQIQHLQQITSISEINNDDDDDDYAVEKKRVVQKQDVEDIGMIVKYKLILYKLELEELDQYLFIDSENDEINIFQIKDNMMNYPFELSDKQAELLARYLIEDNTEASILFNGELTGNIPRIRSIFKNLIGKYNLQDDINEQISDFLNKNYIVLQDNIIKLKSNQLNPQQEGYLTLTEFKDIFSDLTKIQLDQVLAQNYQHTKDTNLIDCQFLFQFYSQATTVKDNQDYE